MICLQKMKELFKKFIFSLACRGVALYRQYINQSDSIDYIYLCTCKTTSYYYFYAYDLFMNNQIIT